MQQRAMERVREMNRSSETALEMAKKELESEPSKQEARPKRHEPVQPIKTKHTNMPPNFPKEHNQNTREQELKSEPVKEKSESRESGILDAIMKEPDRALLMGLLMLLKSEGADEILMLALTYIMA